jgi:3-(3-hydroxy-phenyl)propionate hydroxylase
VLRDTDAQTRAWMVRHGGLVAARDAAIRLAHRSGLIQRSYLPVLAGRRLRYDPAGSDALYPPAAGEDRGVLRVGTALTPDLLGGLGLPPGGPSGWAVVHGGRPAVRLPGVPEIAAPGLTGLPGCARTAFAVVRPDGIVAARGREGDVGGVRGWLAAVSVPTAAPAGIRSPSLQAELS